MDVINHLDNRLLFAVPKKGRLNAKCLELLAGIDLKFRKDDRKDIALVSNHNVALVFLPASDIPSFVSQGKISLGITGRDQVAEHEAAKPPTATSGVEELLDLRFGGCKLQVQVPENGPYKKPDQLIGKRISTSFTHLTEKYFRELEAKHGAAGEGEAGKLKTDIEHLSGSVEAACSLGIADGIVDLVESGTTMRAAGLEAIDTVFDTTAILIKSKNAQDSELISRIEARLKGVITAQKFVLCTYNVARSNLERARQITPGKRAPTITSLAEESGDWVAVQAMVDRSSIADVMDSLSEVGATDIIVTKIENTRTA